MHLEERLRGRALGKKCGENQRCPVCQMPKRYEHEQGEIAKKIKTLRLELKKGELGR